MSRADFIANALAADTDDCVIWPFAVRKSSGYPAHSYGGAAKINVDAHRFVCLLAHGEPLPGRHAAHSCGNKLCVNPKHLSWKKPVENMRDAINAGTLRGGGRYRQRIFAHDVAYIAQSNKSLLELAQEYGSDPAYMGRLRRSARAAA